MGLKLSELCNMGYQIQAMALAHKLKENHEANQIKQAGEWIAIGATVNYSFFEATNKKEFSKIEIIQAIKDLKVPFHLIKGKRWWEFWKNNDSVKLFNAIKAIKI